MNIEIIHRQYSVIAIDSDTGLRIGYHDSIGGRNCGYLLGEYVQPETYSQWKSRVERYTFPRGGLSISN